MKTRTDFVSNSSSTSFIISTDGVDLQKLDKRFFKLIGKCKHLYFFSGDEKLYSEDLKKEVTDFFKKKISCEDDVIELKLKNIDWTDNVIALVKKLLFESKRIDCDYGCDDCGEYVGEATQVCTVLELLYGIVAEGDDHFDYSSIKRLGVDV